MVSMDCSATSGSSTSCLLVEVLLGWGQFPFFGIDTVATPQKVSYLPIEHKKYDFFGFRSFGPSSANLADMADFCGNRSFLDILTLVKPHHVTPRWKDNLMENRFRMTETLLCPKASAEHVKSIFHLH